MRWWERRRKVSQSQSKEGLIAKYTVNVLPINAKNTKKKAKARKIMHLFALPFRIFTSSRKYQRDTKAASPLSRNSIPSSNNSSLEVGSVSAAIRTSADFRAISLKLQRRRHGWSGIINGDLRPLSGKFSVTAALVEPEINRKEKVFGKIKIEKSGQNKVMVTRSGRSGREIFRMKS